MIQNVAECWILQDCQMQVAYKYRINIACRRKASALCYGCAGMALQFTGNS